MKFKSWKRVFSGILAAVTVISSCTAGPVMAASEETETGYPTLQEVIEQLDEDEIVRPSDYIVPVGSDFNIKVDFSNLDVPDWSKVNIYFDDAYNANGEFFTTDHADSYRAVYYVEPVSDHPIYQISRNVRVKETEKPKENTTENSSVSSSSNGGGTPSASGGAENEAEDDSSGDDSQSNSSAAGEHDSGTDSVNADESGNGSASASSEESASSGTDSGSGSSVNDSEPASSGDDSESDKADDTSGDTATTGTDSSAATTESNPAESDNETESMTDSSLIPDTDSTMKTDDESSVRGIDTDTAEDKKEETEEKTSLLTTILSGIANLFKSDEITIPEDELIDEAACRRFRRSG